MNEYKVLLGGFFTEEEVVPMLCDLYDALLSYGHSNLSANQWLKGMTIGRWTWETDGDLVGGYKLMCIDPLDR